MRLSESLLCQQIQKRLLALHAYSLVDKLSDDQKAKTKAMALDLKAAGAEIEVSGDDYNTSSSSDGFVEVDAGAESSLPFK